MTRTRKAVEKTAPVQNDLTHKDALVKTAVELFSKHGFKGTSIRAIARHQGLSVSNMYHYFENKEDLWLACQEYLLRWFPDRLESVWQESSDPLERFKLLLKANLDASVQFQKELTIFMMDQDHISKKASIKHRQSQQRVIDIYVAHLESLKKAGYVVTRNTKVLAFNILGVTNWYLRWYRPDGPLTQEEVLNEIIDFTLRGAIGKIVLPKNAFGKVTEKILREPIRQGKNSRI